LKKREFWKLRRKGALKIPSFLVLTEDGGSKFENTKAGEYQNEKILVAWSQGRCREKRVLKGTREKLCRKMYPNRFAEKWRCEEDKGENRGGREPQKKKS